VQRRNEVVLLTVRPGEDEAFSSLSDSVFVLLGKYLKTKAKLERSVEKRELASFAITTGLCCCWWRNKNAKSRRSVHSKNCPNEYF
jgi:hypothetical protein